MRRMRWLAFAYVLVLGTGTALALQFGAPTALPVSAPVGGSAPVAEPARPWEVMRLPGTAGIGRTLATAVTWILGGYGADPRSAIAAVFPGMSAR